MLCPSVIAVEANLVSELGVLTRPMYNALCYSVFEK